MTVINKVSSSKDKKSLVFQINLDCWRAFIKNDSIRN